MPVGQVFTLKLILKFRFLDLSRKFELLRVAECKSRESSNLVAMNIKFPLFSFLFLLNLSAQGQYYGITPEPVCWNTSGGVDSSIFYVSISAAVTTKPTSIHYFTWNGTTIIPVTVSGGTVTPGLCGSPGSMDSSMASIFGTVGYFIAPDTIDANTAHSVYITNFGSSTHDVIVDGVALRLSPGEQYRFIEYYDRLRNEWHYNPQIIITAGVSTVNNTRKVVFPK